MKYAQRNRKSKHKLRNKMHEVLDETMAQVANEHQDDDMLLREIHAEALSRVERSARTQADFELIVNAWDLAESNRQKVDERHTAPLYNVKKDVDTGDFEEIDEVVCADTVFPIPYKFVFATRYWRQLMNGDFLDYIHDCAYEMHLAVTGKYFSQAIEQLTDTQKEILYMMVIEEKSPQQIAEYRNQTPRNINKVYRCAVESIYRYLGVDEEEVIRKNQAKITAREERKRKNNEESV